MPPSSKNSSATSKKGRWNALILGGCIFIILLILWSLWVFLASVQEMDTVNQEMERAALPTYPTLTVHQIITPYIFPTDVMVTFIIPNFNPPNIQQSCVISAGRYICSSYQSSGSGSVTFTPSITPSPTSTSTPTPTATATPTYTPTATSTPTPGVLELPQTRAGLSLLSTICLTALLIGILVSVSRRRSKP